MPDVCSGCPNFREAWPDRSHAVVGRGILRGMRSWLQHAFAIESAENFAPSEAEARLVRKLCQLLAQRHLTLPALVIVESLRPLAYVGAQTLWCLEPWFAAVTDAAGLRTLAAMLERPGAVDYLLDELQNAEQAETKSANNMSQGAAPPDSPQADAL